MDSKGDVRHFFWLVFRKPLARILLLFEAFASGFPRPDFEMIAERIQTSVYLAIVFFSMVFLAKLFCMVESCCCTADKRVTWGIFRRAFCLAGARILRRNCGKTAEYLAIVYVFLVRVSCDVGGLETCFLWIPKVTFGTFSGLCFASLWHESCCCLRLSQAVFQGQISRWLRSESRRAFTWL